MRLNWIPLLFLPGVCVCGYFVDQWVGLAWAVLLWAGVVVAGTVVHAIVHFAPKRDQSSVDYPLTDPPSWR